MSNRIAGEVIALERVEDADGRRRLTAVIATTQGTQVGVLVAPSGGAPGPLRFLPVPQLAERVGVNQSPTMSPRRRLTLIRLLRDGPRRARGARGAR